MTDEAEWVPKGDLAYEKGDLTLWRDEPSYLDTFDTWILEGSFASVVEFPAAREANRSDVLKRADAIFAALQENPA